MFISSTLTSAPAKIALALMSALSTTKTNVATRGTRTKHAPPVELYDKYQRLLEFRNAIN